MNIPEPKIDPDPDPGNQPGGVDAVQDQGTFPPVPPDEPLNAQMVDEEVPAAAKEPQSQDTAANTDDPSTEPPD